ncbi:hypothetical protein F6X40_39705 [Paraburkholderia sp. UCT31]|uniref:hypothetical protein n=1 Tax=Paraburkholderia sp. UCT31 TaxID=2615209 RepID=UPI00165555C8|nr:hypothetical protein [Paraburkholderia sp. UCT31]MBC8742615.1 hypothetical protein [Paraburkholderia sp. UCT31]
MKTALEKCKLNDLVYISDMLDSYLSFTDDRKRKRFLACAGENPCTGKSLIDLMDQQIRYYGSSDVAYVTRLIFKDDPGVSSDEIVRDVIKKMKLSVKMGGCLDAKLQRVASAMVEKELASKSPQELAKAFTDMGIDEIKLDLIKDHLKKNGKVAVLPVVMKILGPEITLGIIETIIVSMIAQIIGREAAKQLIKELLKRHPWINAIGPIVWALSAAWVACDLQGPAFRKTVPVTLYLGVVALRGENISTLRAAA